MFRERQRDREILTKASVMEAQKVFGHATFKINIFALGLYNRISSGTVRNIAQVKKRHSCIAQTVEHGIMKCIPSMHCMPLWMKANAKCTSVNIKHLKNNCSGAYNMKPV